MAKQFLKGAKINPALKQMGGKAMTQHMRIHHPELGPSSDLLHNSPQGASRERSIALWSRQVNTFEKTPELCVGTSARNSSHAAELFAVLPAIYYQISEVAPHSNSYILGMREGAFLLRNDVPKQISTPAPSQVFMDGFRRRRTEVDDVLFPLCANRKAALSEVNQFDTNPRNLANTTARRVEQLD
jgi:hypothetical protein